MIICIAGLSGSGKNSVGELVARRLNLRLVNPTFKTIAAKQKMSLMEFHKKAEHEHSIDKEFDAHLQDEARRGNCVVTTWLGPWMIKNANMKVWLFAPKQSRAARVAGRDNMTVEQALAHINDRDESNHMRYHEVYGINIYDHSGFELVINTDKFMPEESAEIICAAAKGKLIGPTEQQKKPSEISVAKGIYANAPAKVAAERIVVKKAAKKFAKPMKRKKSR